MALNPSTPTDELRGVIMANLPQMNATLDSAKIHYDVFKDLGVTPDNAGGMQDKISRMYKALRLEVHPDKAAEKREDKSDEEFAAYQQLMAERFKKLQEAFEILSDPVKRNTYNSMLKNQAAFHVYTSDAAGIPDFDASKSAGNVSTFRTNNCTQEDVEKEFNDFVKARIGDASMTTSGYSARYFNDASGQRVLELSFPNQETAYDCIRQLQAKNMITSTHQALKGAEHAPEEVKADAAPGVRSPYALPDPKATPQLTRGGGE